MKVGTHKLPEEKYIEALAGLAPALKRYKGLITVAVLVILAGAVAGILALHQRTEASVRAWAAVFDLDSADKVASAESAVAGFVTKPRSRLGWKSAWLSWWWGRVPCRIRTGFAA